MSVIEGVAPLDLRKIDDGHKPIPDPESPELDMASDSEPEQPDCFRSDEDPKSPELEMSSDTEPEQPFCLISDDGVRRFSHLREMLNFMSKSDNQTNGDNQTDRGLRKMEDSDVQIYDGHKQIPDSKSPEVEVSAVTQPEQPYRLFSGVGIKQIDGGVRKVEDRDVQIYDGHKPIPDPESPELDMVSDTEPEQPHSFRSDEDPESPELEMSSDTEPEQPFCLISDDGVRRFSDLREMLNFMSKSDNQTDGDNQIDRGKQMVIDEGESQTSSTKSRKRKRTTPCCTCPQSPAKTLEWHLPEGHGYVPYAPCVDKNVKAMNSKSDMSRKCIHCRNKTRAKTKESPLPEGYEKLKPDARKKVHKVKRILRPSRRALIRLFQ